MTVASAGVPAASADRDILVYAAASLTDALTAIGGAYTNETGVAVSLSFASSSALARQIENGAPVAVFISANRAWMDRLQAKGLIAPDSRIDIAANRLALIAPRSSTAQVSEIEASLPLTAMLEGGRLALGDPDHVPAGIYGRAALETLGLWQSVEPHLARTGDVRGALALVARGETPLGLVYATDARVSDEVRTLGLFPADSHPPIVYPAALIDPASDEARRFLDYLGDDAARAVLSRLGFSAPPRSDLDSAG